MALVQHITHEIGGEISIQPTTRPGTAKVTVYDDVSTVYVNNATATISSINTVLINAATKRDKVIYLSNATTVSEGSIFKLTNPTEWVKCKKVSGNAVTLWHPLREDHANAINAHGTQVTYTVVAGNAQTKFFDGRVRWELDGVPQYTGIEVTRYPLKRLATEQDIFEIHPQFAQLMAAEEDPNAALDAAHEYVLETLGTKGRARVYPASSEFIQAVALAFARNHYRHQASETATLLFERYSQELTDAMARLLATLTPDDDQDGEVELEEKRSYFTFNLTRG